jgi:hypothetical protein
MSPELDVELKSSEDTVWKVKQILNGDTTSDDLRSWVGVGFIDQAIEHHSAITLLMRSGKDGSAFALARSVIEILYRGVWLTACATDGEVKKFVEKDKIDLALGDMSVAIDTTCGLDYFAEFKKQSWNVLNSYAHTGILQIGRRFTENALVPSYTDAERIEVLRATTSAILLLVRPFLARQGLQESAKEIDKLMSRSNAEREPVTNTSYTLGSHIVAFIDALGQRERFRELKIPKTADEHAHVEKVLTDTAGFVVKLREMYRKQFAAFAAGISRQVVPVEVSVQPNFVGFSDSFVTSVPLRNDAGDLTTIVRMFSALSAAAILMLTSLAAKHPLRGGIDVGLATEIGPGEIYGTALERAYLLECQRAEYPRIVIGDEAWRYLLVGREAFEQLTTPSAKAVAAVIRRTMELISTDADGQRILDYLGPVIKDLMTPDEVKLMVKPAYDFVVSEQAQFVAKGESKLSVRYGRLRTYFESRIQLWGIVPNG